MSSRQALHCRLWIAVVALGPWIAPADWPQLRGNAQRTALTSEALPLSLHLQWTVAFAGERIGTAVEPIVTGGRVFVATHAGHLYALDLTTGAPLWRFAAPGPLLHAPAVENNRVILAAAGAGAGVYALDATNGRLVWTAAAEASGNGFAAAPLVARGHVFIGSRDGHFYCLDLATGAVRWRAKLPAPVRQPAAWDGTRVIVTAEDLVARAFVAEGPEAGRLVWQQPLQGQSARDYPPMVVAGQDGRRRVVIRTSPPINAADRLNEDRAMLTRQAGIDASSWEELDAWLKSDAARGTPELWAAEQTAVRAWLETNVAAQTFFVLDAETGALQPRPPVLWTGGCQGVGNPPALTLDGRLLVMYRSVYGNWNLGVAPLVALGLLDLEQNRIEPLFHEHGRQPPWNTFWGTADEAQSFTLAGPVALVVHQATLSAFDLPTRHLANLHGARDTYGGFPRNPPWARNEWHGPARGGVARAAGRVLWITGSRLLCLSTNRPTAPPQERIVQADTVSGDRAPQPASPDLRAQLRAAVAEVLDRQWSPLAVEPGVAERELFFAHSAELFSALAWAYPHLAGDPLQARVRERLALEWERHPPFSDAGAYPVATGARREFHPVPPGWSGRPAKERPPHPFGHLPAVWLYASRVGETNRVRAAWPQLRAAFEQWAQSGWRLDGQRGDLHANRYLGALLALQQLAELAGDSHTATAARRQFDALGSELLAWWRRAAQEGTLTSFAGVGELDRFIGNGDALSFRVWPHRHKVALFRDLTPELADWIRRETPQAVTAVWDAFTRLYATWWLVGEERQVHFGENLFDPPDLALGAFQALAWLRGANPDELARHVDRPFARADLYHLTKLALALEPMTGGESTDPQRLTADAVSTPPAKFFSKRVNRPPRMRRAGTGSRTFVSTLSRWGYGPQRPSKKRRESRRTHPEPLGVGSLSRARSQVRRINFTV